MPHVSLAAVIKRQVLEGVQAVVKLYRLARTTGKIPLQLFDRTGGASNVRFEGESALDQLSNVLMAGQSMMILKYTLRQSWSYEQSRSKYQRWQLSLSIFRH